MPEKSNVISKPEIVTGSQNLNRLYWSPFSRWLAVASRHISRYQDCPARQRLYGAIGVSEEMQWDVVGRFDICVVMEDSRPWNVHHLRLSEWSETPVLNACSMGIRVPAAVVPYPKQAAEHGRKCRSFDVPSSIPQDHGSNQFLSWCLISTEF